MNHRPDRLLAGALFLAALSYGACDSESAAPSALPCVPGAGASGAGGGASGAGGAAGGSAWVPPDVPLDVLAFTEGGLGNNFHHPAGEAEVANQKDPFELLAERADEGPPEIRTRLHSCSRLSYASIGAFLTSRGVDLAKTSQPGQPPTAGEVYKAARDALGAARFDVRQAESFTYTVAGGTKLLDIFIQSAEEIIANVKTATACGGEPMFDATTGACVYSSFSCILGRPATPEDLVLCNEMLKNAPAAELDNRRRVVVATFLSAGNTCE
jgi:hypothetical protein